MQNSIQKFMQIYFWETRYFIWKFENFDKFTNYHRFDIFLKLCTRFLLTNVYKSMFRIFFILFKSWVIRPGFYTLVLYIFINNSRSKQSKKIPNTILLTLLSTKRLQKFEQKTLNSMVVGAHQSFQFFR